MICDSPRELVGRIVRIDAVKVAEGAGGEHEQLGLPTHLMGEIEGRPRVIEGDTGRLRQTD